MSLDPESRRRVRAAPPVKELDVPICGECGRRHVRVSKGVELETCTYHLTRRNADGSKIPCMKLPVSGRVGCRKHFGNLPVGPAHSGWKGGGAYFRIPRGMKDAYDRSLNDPSIASNHHQLAMLDAQIQETLDAIDQDEGVIAAKDLANWIDRERTARATGDLTAISKNAAEVDVIVSRLARMRAARGELREIIEARRKVSATQLELAKFSRDAIMAVELIAVLTKIVESMKRSGASKESIRSVARDFEKMLSTGRPEPEAD